MAVAKYRVELAPENGKRKYLELELKVPHAATEEKFRDAMADGDAKLAGVVSHCTLATALEEWFIDQAELSEVIEFDPEDYDQED